MGALHDIVTKGSVDRSVTLRIADSSTGAPKTDVVYNSSGIDLWYRRQGAAKVSITEVTLAALTTAHADGGFLHIGDGEYRLDLPDAAFATGAQHVDFGGAVTGGVIYGGRVRLIDTSLEDSVRGGMTALPNAAAAASGGLFIRGTGAGAINQDANGRIDVNVAAISTDATAADNLESYCDGTTPQPVNATQISGDSAAADELERWFDGTAGAIAELGILDRGTAQSASSTGMVLRSAAAFADDSLIGCIVMQTGGTNAPQVARITDNVLSTDTITVAAWPNGTPGGSITYTIFGTAPDASGGGGGGGATAQEVWEYATRTLSAGTNLSIPTAASIADAVWDETAADHTSSGTTGQRLSRLPNAAAGANGGLPTVDANNRIAGIQGTITTLDALDTAQDTQHSNTMTRLGSPAGASVSADVAAVKSQTAAIETDTQDIQSRLPAALVSGRMDASVGAMAANVMTAAAAASDLGAEIATATWANGTRTLTAGTNIAIPSVGDIADAVLDEAMAGHTSAGTLGKAVADILEDTGTTLPGTLSTIAGYVDTEVAAIKAVTDKVNTMLEADGGNSKFTSAALAETPVGEGGGLDAAGVRNAIGLSSANLDTQLSGLDTKLGTPAGTSIADDISNIEGGSGGGGATAQEVWEYGNRTLTAGTNIVLAKGTGITGLNDLSEAQVNAQVDAALGDYDGPTKAELDAAIGTVATPAQVLAQATAALTSYDPPTHAEMTAAVGAVETDTQDIQSRLPAALKGGRIDANIGAVHEVAVGGSGTEGNPWGPA